MAALAAAPRPHPHLPPPRRQVGCAHLACHLPASQPSPPRRLPEARRGGGRGEGAGGRRRRAAACCRWRSGSFVSRRCPRALSPRSSPSCGCAPARGQEEKGGAGGWGLWGAPRGSAPSFQRRASPRPNKSCFQGGECFLFFRLALNVPVCS